MWWLSLKLMKRQSVRCNPPSLSQRVCVASVSAREPRTGLHSAHATSSFRGGQAQASYHGSRFSVQ